MFYLEKKPHFHQLFVQIQGNSLLSHLPCRNINMPALMCLVTVQTAQNGLKRQMKWSGKFVFSQNELFLEEIE